MIQIAVKMILLFTYMNNTNARAMDVRFEFIACIVFKMLYLSSFDISNNNPDKTERGRSGEVWHYKIIWIDTPTDSSNPNWVEGGYPILGQFEVILDTGTDADHIHYWYTHGLPTGYGIPVE